MEILKADQLYKTYGTQENFVMALQRTNLVVNKGEFVAIVGPSGSGKSTLLHLLAGLDEPSGGKVFIEDKNIYELKEKALARFRRENIGFIFQFFNLVPVLNVDENIRLPLIMDGKKVDKEYIDEILDALRLTQRRFYYPSQLSGGQQQRVAIARALITRPSIIFADEPTGNLDSFNSKEVLSFLTSSLKIYNQTLVMITHDSKIASLADRIITIEDGVLSKGAVVKNE